MRSTRELSRLYAAGSARAPKPQPPALRGMADILFRYRGMLLSCLGLLTIGFAAYALLRPPMWDAEMTILVNSDTQAAAQTATEVQLLRSVELAAQVVDAAGLAGPNPAGRQRALADFRRRLEVTPLEKSNLIRVRYSSIAPARSQRVLELLSAAFLDRHRTLSPAANTAAFFDQQAKASDRQLADARQRLLQFHQRTGVADASTEKNLYLQKMADLRAEMQKAEAGNADTVRRVDALKARLEQIPARIATTSKQTPNQFSVERLNIILTGLRNRRADLLAAHADSAVKALDEQIANTTASIQVAERTSANEETTGANPLRQSLESELEHAQAAALGLQERMRDLRAQQEGYQRELSRLESLIPVEQDFLRDEKAADEKFMLYSRQREESRIGDILARQKAPGVTLVDPPRATNAPRPRFSRLLMTAYLFGWLLALLAVFVRNQWRRSAFTPWALDRMTPLPVLGTVPARADANTNRRRS